MELREWAICILSAETIEGKLFDPGSMSDTASGSPFFWKTPARPPGMHFQKHSRKNKLPKFCEHRDPDKRAICLHRFAGHELLAVEIMAYALLAFPDAPHHFRRGLAHTLREEQEHFRLYQKRIEELGLKFGDLPQYKHFWAYVPFLTSPLRYISVMSLTLEQANLDFAPLYGASFEMAGDLESAALMQRILRDEISHVSFGFQWLKKWSDKQTSLWNVWRENVPDLMTPDRAHGTQVFDDHRRKAGIPQDWIEKLKIN